MSGLIVDRYSAGHAARQRESAEHRTGLRTMDHRALVKAPRTHTQGAISDPRTSAKGQPIRSPAQWLADIFPKIFTVAVVVALWIGWVNRDDNGLTPVNGSGYWLGIAGSSLMLLLLVYPLRKRLRSLRALGSVSFWFHTHMILGVLGPVLIMWHANFKLGSINCSVALITTLVVATSGVFGRFLHRKVNMGLYGSRAEAEEVMADADELRGFLGSDAEIADRMVAQLNAFAQLATAPRGVFTGLLTLPLIRWRGALIRTQMINYARQVIAIEGRRHRRSRDVQRRQLAGATDFVTQHIGAARKAAALAFFERLFRLWHIFHVPLFILLVIVAIVHVYASHFF
jgi:hypothetical protein